MEKEKKGRRTRPKLAQSLSCWYSTQYEFTMQGESYAVLLATEVEHAAVWSAIIRAIELVNYLRE